jgi:hypothetical protein
MKSTMEKLGISASYSRPWVSNDNPFSEALFRTCKYRPNWPAKGFATKADAQAWVKSFARWYNGEHLHSGIRFVTPGMIAQRSPAAPVSMRMPGHEIRNAGQVKPATGNPPGPSGSTPKTKLAPLKSEKLHEIGGQLV